MKRWFRSVKDAHNTDTVSLACSMMARRKRVKMDCTLNIMIYEFYSLSVAILTLIGNDRSQLHCNNDIYYVLIGELGGSPLRKWS